MTKEQKLELIFDAIRKAYAKQTLVFRDGSADAEIMIVGEAPGANEEKEGKPFVGRAGKLLTATLETLGWKRSDFYVSNIVKYRPQDQNGKTLTPSDREIAIFRPALEKEIAVVDPKLIVVLGRISMMGLGIEGTMSANHGRVIDWNNSPTPNGSGRASRKVLVVYHPAAILRNNNLEPIFREDLSKIRELVV